MAITLYNGYTVVNPALLLSGNLLFGQNCLTPEIFIIPLHRLVM